MVKYTQEKLFELKGEAYNPLPDTLAAFNDLVELVRVHLNAEYEKQKALRWTNGDTYLDDRGNERSYHHMNRRRPSKTGVRPNLRKKAVDVVSVDADGFETRKKTRQSVGAEDDEDEREHFRESVKTSGAVPLRARPNNKNLGSSKAVDSRDVTADKPKRAFNAFAALGDDSDDDDDEDDEE